MRHRWLTLALAAAACATAGKGGPADAGRSPDAGSAADAGSGADAGTPAGVTNPGQSLSLWGGLPRCGAFFVPADQGPQTAAHDNNVLWSGLYSDASSLYLLPAQPGPGDPVTVRLRALAGNLTAANVKVQSAADGSSVTLPLARESALDATGRFEFWSTTLPASPAPRRYRFQAIDGRASAWLNGCGPSAQEPNSQDFWIVPGFAPPAWAQGAVLYQVFPDRFYNGDPTNDPINGAALLGGAAHVTFDSNWSDPPAPNSYLFFGGDLNGVAQKLPYLRDLGVDGIYLNPIFLAPSNHKYDTQDYTQVDPIFGGEAALQTLLSEAHDADAGTLRVVLDGVFNHVGLGEPWFDFYSLYTTLGADKGGVKQPSSPWYDRFTFLPHNVDGCDYAHFQTSCPLVKLDYGSPELKADMFGDGGVVPTWLGAVGADGFRLDAVDLIGTGGVDGQDNAQILEALRASARARIPTRS